VTSLLSTASKTRQPTLKIFGLLRHVREREGAPAVVVSIIADYGGELGRHPHFVVPLVDVNKAGSLVLHSSL